MLAFLGDCQSSIASINSYDHLACVLESLQFPMILMHRYRFSVESQRLSPVAYQFLRILLVEWLKFFFNLSIFPS
jgi:hypothetical protein